MTLLLALAFAPANAQTVSYSAPIVITRGGTYTGNYRSLDSNVPCVLINTTAPVVLDGCLLTGAGNLIQSGEGANVTVRNCIGQGLTPTIINQAPGHFLDSYRSQSLTIEHNAFTQTSGIVVNRWIGSGLFGQTLTVRYNKVRNIDGRWTNGGSTRSSFIILNTVQHLAGVEIAYNEVFNAPDQSLVEDNINLYNSSGTILSAIRVHDNFVRGAYPYPATSSSFTGTGMTTDGDDSTLGGAAGYIEADHNQFVGTGNAAMNLAAGHDIYYHDNRAVTSGTLPDGRTFNATWAGFGVFNYYNQPISVYFNNRLENNTVGYVRWGANAPYTNRQDLSPGACVPCTGTISLPNPITTATEDAEAALWQTKVQQAGVIIGPLNGATATTPTTTPAATTGTIINPSFELDGAAVGSPTGWATLAGTGTSDNADYTEAYGGGHTGTYHATHYRPTAYEVYTYQTITNLPNGTYKLSAWFKSTGSQPVAQLKAQNFGGTALTAAVPASPTTWVQVSVPNIVVTNGQCQIGVYSNAGAGDWLHFDDVELVAQTAAANTPPTVALAASATLTLGQPLSLTATADDADGTVSKVEFFNGSTSLGTATAAPYQLSWTPTAAGSYALSAVATDNSGATTTSATVQVVVAQPAPVVTTSNKIANPSFEVDNAAVAAPTGWLTSGGSTASYTEAYGGAHTGTYHGTHYRTNAYEVFTYQVLTNLTNGTYTFSAWVKTDGGQNTAQLQAKSFGGNPAIANLTDTNGNWVQVTLSGIQVTNGQCEIGFYSKASAGKSLYFDDVTFTAQSATSSPNTPPTVALAASATLTLGQPLSLTATADDADGTVSKVEFFNGSTSLGTATAAPYQLSWTPTAAGSYALSAVATDNSGATTTSATVQVAVTAPVVVATPTSPTLINPSFDADNAAVAAPTGWLTSGGSTASYTEAYGGAHTGTYHGSHWRTNAYEVYTYQVMSGLANGTYTLSAWVKSDGGQNTAQLQAKNFGGATLATTVSNTYGNWVKIEVSNIQVTNGQCEIGFYSKASAYQWMYFDDVAFGLQPVGTVLNSSFEDDNAAVQAPRSWSTQTYGTTQAYASYTEAYGGTHTGSYHGTHYRPEAYEIYTYQVVNNVPNGTYKLNAWVKSSGGQTTAQLKAQNFGGTALATTIPASPGTWVQVTVSGIQVTNGKCEIGLYSKASGGQWLHFDDVELVAQSATSARTAAPAAATYAATSDSELQVKPALYPNPANERVAVTSTFDRAMSVTLVVTDLQGLPVAKYQRLTTVGENQFILNTADLPTGLYLLRVAGDTNTPAQRLEIKH